MKLIRPFICAAFLLACALVAQIAHAAPTCSDDPERCVLRGAGTHVSSAVPLSAGAVTAMPAATVPAPRRIVPAPVHKPAARAAHVAPSASAPTPATPGMGMLLKLSAGAPGEVSWFPSHPADNSGASWVL